MSKGLTNREIGEVLNIGTGTVKTHAAAIIASLDVSNRTEAVSRLCELGLNQTRSPGQAAVDGFGNRGAIAVLPLDTFSSDPEVALLADGVAEDLITTLARWRWFPVISRNSTFTYRGRSVDVRQVGTELGADYVVEGSLRAIADHVRITVQVTDGQDGQQVWAKRVDAKISEIMSVSDKIVDSIVASLEPTLTKLAGLRVLRRKTESLNAWQSIHRGFYHLMQHTEADCAMAADFFDRAITLDSQLSTAHSFWAYCQLQEAVLSGRRLDGETLIRVQQSSDRGKTIDAFDPMAHLVSAWCKMYSNDYEQALVSADRALDLEPSHAWTHSVRAMILAFTGQAEEGCESALCAIRLSPRDPELCYMYFNHGLCLASMGRYPEAIERYRAAKDLAPHVPQFYVGLAICYAMTGDNSAGEQVLAELVDRNPGYDPRVAMLGLIPDEHLERMVDVLRTLGWIVHEEPPTQPLA